MKERAPIHIIEVTVLRHSCQLIYRLHAIFMQRYHISFSAFRRSQVIQKKEQAFVEKKFRFSIRYKGFVVV